MQSTMFLKYINMLPINVYTVEEGIIAWSLIPKLAKMKNSQK